MTERYSAELLTVSEAAEKSGLTKYQIYRLIHNGTLTSVQVRGQRHKFRIRADALAAFLSGDYLERPASEDPWLTVQQVAAKLGCGHESVRHMVADGDLRALRFKGRASHIRIRESALADYIARHETREALSA